MTCAELPVNDLGPICRNAVRNAFSGASLWSAG
jgi:hypothetical protein